MLSDYVCGKSVRSVGSMPHRARKESYFRNGCQVAFKELEPQRSFLPNRRYLENETLFLPARRVYFSEG